jgi:hypothetical protein
MKRSRYLGIVGLLTALAAGGPMVLAQDYPLAPGTRWTYHLRKEVAPGVQLDGEDGRVAKNNVVDVTMISHVAGTEQIDGKSYTRIEGYRDGKLSQIDWYALTADGLMHARSIDNSGAGESDLKPPEKLLSPTLAPNESWTWRDAGGTVSSKTSVGAAEQITVPAGSYRAIPLETTMEMPTQGGPPARVTINYWFVPAVGYVKLELRAEVAGTELFHNTMVLEKFEPAATH